MSGRLVIEDGTVLHCKAFGARGVNCGELVFNTSLTGYQEILTDPSYAGQIVVMTAPQIGNTGLNALDDESRAMFANGLVVRELSPRVSNWRSEESLEARLEREGMPAVQGADTRALTLMLRQRGTVKAAVCTDAALSDAEVLETVRGWHGLDGVDLAARVTCKRPYKWTDGTPEEWGPAVQPGPGFDVVVYDFGVKRGILRRLVSHGCRVTVVPAATSAAEVLAMRPHGVVLSNGPGDPAAVGYAVEAARQLIAARIPILGICLGHQILGQAFGARTYRLKFGHHGGNQPVKHLPSGRVEISAHNHNFAVDASTLPSDVVLTHLNLNDQCCEGFARDTVLSVQYHPEAAPGPHDAEPIFGQFLALMASTPAPVEV